MPFCAANFRMTPSGPRASVAHMSLSPKPDDFAARVACASGKGSLHPVGELVTNKRLSNNLRLVDVSQRRHLYIARDEDYGTRGTFSTHLSSDFHSIHARHRKIQDDELNVSVLIQQI